jgi:hypothetical protein
LNGWTYNDTTSMQQYLAKAPASKIILGVPYYGYKWSTTTNQPYGSAVPGTPANADTYQGVLDDFNCGPQQLAKAFDSTGQSPWATWWSPAASDPCDGNHNSWRELYYDDANSLGLKYDLVNANNLRGTGMWALGYDGTSQDLWKELALKFGSPWPGQYHALTPSRILDTRTVGGPVGPGQVRPAQVTGRGGVPDTGVAAVVLNVTVTNVTQSSYLSIYPAGVARPLASNLDYGPGQTVANLVEVPLGVKGQVSLYNNGGSANVILDVQGWISIVWMNSGSAGRWPHRGEPDTRLAGDRAGRGAGRGGRGRRGQPDRDQPNRRRLPDRLSERCDPAGGFQSQLHAWTNGPQPGGGYPEQHRHGDALQLLWLDPCGRRRGGVVLGQHHDRGHICVHRPAADSDPGYPHRDGWLQRGGI